MDGPLAPGLPGAWIEWIRQKVGEPTDFQWRAWTALEKGGDFLLRSGTGSGKTLAAILPPLASLIPTPTPQPLVPTRGVQILYMAPLKALVADLHVRLTKLVEELWATIASNLVDSSPQGSRVPRVFAWTGDTPFSQRRFFRINPAEILLTTPESLARMLCQPSRKTLFESLHHVIVDEWHALAGTKRGADLSLMLSRLDGLSMTRISRVGLSATIANPTTLANALGCPSKPVQVISKEPGHFPRMEIVSKPAGARRIPWIAQTLIEDQNQSRNLGCLLCFVSTRKQAEELAYQLRKMAGELRVDLHHGSLSRQAREDTEQATRLGLTDILVASGSMELGVDLGTIRKVYLVDPPGEAIRLLQRVGRSGRGPGNRPKGVILASSSEAAFEAAATASLTFHGWMEPIHPPIAPLDVLCQHLIGEAMVQPSPFSAPPKWVRESWYYQSLQERDFQFCLDFLRGWPDAEGTPRLPSRLHSQGDGWTIPRKWIKNRLRDSLGTIVTEPWIPVMEVSESGHDLLKGPMTRPIGHIDEWYAETIQPGDRFLLNGKSWERAGGDHKEILAREVRARPMVLRWNGLRAGGSPSLAWRWFGLRGESHHLLRQGARRIQAWLQDEFPLGPDEAESIFLWLEEQDRLSQIPESGTVLVEVHSAPPNWVIDLHWPLARQLGQTVARLMATIATDNGWSGMEFQPQELGIRILWDSQRGPSSVDSMIESVRTLATPPSWKTLRERAFRDSDGMRKKFQDAAEISLMILPPSHRSPRTRVGGRAWSARRLYERLAAFPDQPLPIRQAYRDLWTTEEETYLDRWFGECTRWNWVGRHLEGPSPFCRSWQVPMASQTAEIGLDPLARALDET